MGIASTKNWHDFWNVISEFNGPEVSRFLKFVWESQPKQRYATALAFRFCGSRQDIAWLWKQYDVIRDVQVKSCLLVAIGDLENERWSKTTLRRLWQILEDTNAPLLNRLDAVIVLTTSLDEYNQHAKETLNHPEYQRIFAIYSSIKGKARSAATKSYVEFIDDHHEYVCVRAKNQLAGSTPLGIIQPGSHENRRPEGD